MLSPNCVHSMRCRKCEEYLSLGPIRILGNRPICGRCVEQYSITSGERAKFLELFANLIVNWPCRYDERGCMKCFKWNESREHELICEYGPLWCPAIGCDEIIRKIDLEEHFTQFHVNLMMKKCFFEISLNPDLESVRCNKMVKIRDQIFIVRKHIIAYTVYLNVSCISEFDNLFCNIKIIVENENISSDNYQKVTKYSEKCDVDDTYIQEGAFFKYTVHKRAVILFTIDNSIHNEELLEKDILSLLECDICLNFCRPLFALCKFDHLICNDCIVFCQKSVCILCSEPLQYRNTVFNNIAEKLKFPCKYQKDGCTIYDCLSKISIHESSCPCIKKQLQYCFLRDQMACNWLGPYPTLSNHLSLFHLDQFVSLGREITFPLDDLQQKILITEFDNEFFQSTVNYTRKTGLIVLTKLLSNLTNSIKYKFFLELCNPPSYCMTNSIDIVEETLQNYLTRPPASITPFIRENNLSFSLHIERIQ